MSNPGSQIPQVGDTLGALLVGVMLSSSLWGTSCLQCYSYFENRHRKTSWFSGSFVTIVWLLDTTHQALLCHAAYVYLITHYADTTYLAIIVRSITLQILFSSLLALLAQLFSVWRIWLVTRKNAYIVVPLLILVVAQFVLSIAYFARGYTIQAVADEHKLDALAKVSAALSCFTNAPLAVMLLYNAMMSPQLLRSGETTLSRTVAFAINSGLFTSAMAVVTFVTVLASPRTYTYLVFYTLTAKLYSNSLLAVLNSYEPVNGFQSGDQSGSNGSGYPGAQGQGQGPASAAHIGPDHNVGVSRSISGASISAAMYSASRNANAVAFGVYDGTIPRLESQKPVQNGGYDYTVEGQYHDGKTEEYRDSESESHGHGGGGQDGGKAVEGMNPAAAVMSVVGLGSNKVKNRKSIVSSFLSLK